MARRKRKNGNQRTKAVFVIACEDSKSAPTYMKSLFRLYAHRVTPVFAKRDANRTAPRQVVERAIDRWNELEARGKEDQAWAVFDAEPQAGAAHKDQIRQARELARREDIEVAVSNPCIEHWLHLHLQDVDGGHGSSKNAVDAFSTSWRNENGSDYSKGKTDLACVVSEDKVAEAARRAKAQHERKDIADPECCSPCVTDMYRLVEALSSLST